MSLTQTAPNVVASTSVGTGPSWIAPNSRRPHAERLSRVIVCISLAMIAAAYAARSDAAPTPFEEHACIACHSLDGTPLRGPTLAGLRGSSRTVIRNGKRTTVTADSTYIALSIREPNADTVEGYPAGAMPKLPLDDTAVATLVSAIEALPAAPAPPQTKSIALLAASAAAFVVLHLVLASLPVRRRLVARLGENWYGGVFSALALASFIGMTEGFRRAPFVQLWISLPQLRWLPNIVMPVAWLLLVCSMTTKSPTLAGKPGAAPVSEAVGVIRVTRHPMLWSFTLGVSPTSLRTATCAR